MALNSVIDGLDRATPESRGMKSHDILHFLTDAKASGVELNSFLLYRRDAIISEGCRYPYQPNTRRIMHSATKSFLSVAVGMAVQEGFFSLEDKVMSFFPEHLPPNPDSKMTVMRVEHLLTQTCGHATAASGGTWRGIKTSWIEQFFKLPVVHEPGTYFKYTSATSFLLSAIIQRTTGQSTWQYLMPRLFQPLGITDLKWDVGPDGINPGGNGISCRPSDLLKLAILHLQGGMWEGRRLLTEGWVSKATRSQRGNEYGYHWWVGKGNSYYAYGLFGQFAFVFPEHEAILVTTSSEPVGETKLRALVWRHFPAIFESGVPPSSSSDLQLQEYLHGLQFSKPVMPVYAGDVPDISDRLFVAEPNADSIEGYSFDFEIDRCIFHLWDHRGLHRVDVGLSDWIQSKTTISGALLHHGYEPSTLTVVAEGRWTSSNTFEMNWHFIETAFRDHLVFRILDNKGAILERSVNVNSFALQRPPICAHILESGTGTSAGLRISGRASNFLSSSQFKALPVPGRTVPYSTSGTSIEELLGNTGTKAVLVKEIPEIMANSKLESMKSYTLLTIASHIPGIDDGALCKIDEELYKVSSVRR